MYNFEQPNLCFRMRDFYMCLDSKSIPQDVCTHYEIKYEGQIAALCKFNVHGQCVSREAQGDLDSLDVLEQL